MALLAHLYTHIRGSQEDIATLSLQYLLSQSFELNKAFTKRVASHLEISLDEYLQYICQVSGNDKERPDMTGNNNAGNEILLCEMKFYAGLTPNQPLAYIDRLKANNGNGLIFICPTNRRTSLWTKLKEICSVRVIEPINDFCISVDKIHMAIMTWTETLELMKQVAGSLDIRYLSDIQQLEGYCAQMDSDAFIPFIPEDLTANVAIQADRYYTVIDETINLLCNDDTIQTSKKGLKASAYRRGYTQGLYIDEFAISLNYDRDLWKSCSSVETPFWVAIRNHDWTQDDHLCRQLNKLPDTRVDKKGDSTWGNLLFLALEPLQNATLDEVCNDLKYQILTYLDTLQNA